MSIMTTLFGRQAIEHGCTQRIDIHVEGTQVQISIHTSGAVNISGGLNE